MFGSPAKPHTFLHQMHNFHVNQHKLIISALYLPSGYVCMSLKLEEWLVVYAQPSFIFYLLFLFRLHIPVKMHCTIQMANMNTIVQIVCSILIRLKRIRQSKWQMALRSRQTMLLFSAGICHLNSMIFGFGICSCWNDSFRTSSF